MGSTKDLNVPAMTSQCRRRETRPKETEELELASAHYKEIIFQLKKKKELPSEKEIQGIIKRETD